MEVMCAWSDMGMEVSLIHVVGGCGVIVELSPYTCVYVCVMGCGGCVYVMGCGVCVCDGLWCMFVCMVVVGVCVINGWR